MAQPEEITLRISEIHGRKELKEQVEALNKNLLTLVDELKKVHAGLADVSLAIRQSALSKNQEP